MSDKHFNKGVVWGIVERFEPRKVKGAGRTTYAQLTLKCHSDKFGQVRTFGRLYDVSGREGVRENVKTLKIMLEQDPMTVVNLSGIYYQYKKRGQLYRGFTFFEVRRSAEIQHRASCILTGELDEKIFRSDTRMDELILNVRKFGKKDQHDTFSLFAEPRMVAEVPVGSLVQFNCTLADPDAEWGGSNREALTMIKKAHVIRGPQ